VTTFITWLALAVSAASLVWQMVVWRRSGPVLVIYLYEVNESHRFPGAWVIELSNNGRQAVTVSEVRLTHRQRYPAYVGNLHIRWGLSVGAVERQTLPVVLEPGAVINIYSTSSEPGYLLEIDAATRTEHGLEVDPSWQALVPEARVGSTWRQGTYFGAPLTNMGRGASSHLGVRRRLAATR
jgi:hypothetical protein